MSLATLSITDVYRHLRPEEVLAYQPPEGEDLDAVTARLLMEQCDKVASYVNATGNPRLLMGTSSVPSECVGATLALVRYAMLALLPGDGLASTQVGSTRRAEYDEALRFLDKVADGTVSIHYEPKEGITESGSSVIWGINNEVKEWGEI